MDGYFCRHCGQLFDTYASLCHHIRELELSAAALGAEDTSQHRDKRKQKQPKLVMAAEAEDEDEEVNVVSPVPADERKDRPLDRDLPELRTDGVLRSEIRMEPIRSIMNRSSMQVCDFYKAFLACYCHLATSVTLDVACCYCCSVFCVCLSV